MRSDDVMKVGCPVCEVLPGFKCQHPDGSQSLGDYFHKARIWLASAALSQPAPEPTQPPEKKEWMADLRAGRPVRLKIRFPEHDRRES